MGNMDEVATTGRAEPAIVGYYVARKVTQDEIPSTISATPKNVVGLLGGDGTHFMVPLGIDVLELGVIENAGHFMLIPFDSSRHTLWDLLISVVVTEEQAAAQREIVHRFYKALLTQLPHDAADLDAGVAWCRERGQPHPVFETLRDAAVDTWAAERRRAEPLEEAERARLDVAVARRVVETMRTRAPRVRLDRQSLRSIVDTHVGCQWDRILWAVDQGDYEDAATRLLARIKINRKLQMPVSLLLRVLPGVHRLDVFFLVLGRATEHPVPALLAWLEHGPVGADAAAAEVAVRVLYGIWRMTADADRAKASMRAHVHRIQCAPASEDARLIKVWLDMVHAFSGEYEVPKDKLDLFNRVEAAIERWERALMMSLEEIFVSLPETAA